jgi:DNA-binding response OmpR family regulator
MAANILIVEDDHAVLELIGEYLRSEGLAQFATASTVQEARTMWKKHLETLSLIITDLTLPDGQGSQIACEFLAEKRTVRAIITTGFAAEYIELGGEIANRAVLLQKPFTRTELINVVHACLSPQHSA